MIKQNLTSFCIVKTILYPNPPFTFNPPPLLYHLLLPHHRPRVSDVVLSEGVKHHKHKTEKQI